MSQDPFPDLDGICKNLSCNNPALFCLNHSAYVDSRTLHSIQQELAYTRSQAVVLAQAMIAIKEAAQSQSGSALKKIETIANVAIEEIEQE